MAGSKRTGRVRIYEILLVGRRGTGYVPTKQRFFIAIPSEAAVQQFVLDEEKRSGYDVYAKPVRGEVLDLVLYSKIGVDVPDDEIHTLNIFKEREVIDEQLH